MRIIGGRFKGKKISFLNNNTTRPLRDLVKENIFNLIEHSNKVQVNLTQSTVLDLFSGVGSFGLECISRSAKKVVFVERDNLAFSILKKNINDLLVKNQAESFFLDIENFLEKLKPKNEYDIIFLDPPYKNSSNASILELIKKTKIFKDPHLVIIHKEYSDTENFENLLKIIFIKNYGRSKIVFGTFI